MESQTESGIPSYAGTVQEFVERLRGLPVDARYHPALGLICFFDDDFHENYDYDVLGPRHRDAVHRVAKALGWRRRGSREVGPPDGSFSVLLPRPSGVLGTSPLDVVRPLISPGVVLCATPTQAMLLALDAAAAPEATRQRLEAIAREHPANLPKIADWVGETRGAELFRAWRADLAALQAETVARRRGR